MEIIKKIFAKIDFSKKKNEEKINLVKAIAGLTYYILSLIFGLIVNTISIIIALLKPIVIFFIALAIFDI